MNPFDLLPWIVFRLLPKGYFDKPRILVPLCVVALGLLVAGGGTAALIMRAPPFNPSLKAVGISVGVLAYMLVSANCLSAGFALFRVSHGKV